MPSTIKYDSHQKAVRSLVYANARASQIHRQKLDSGIYYMNGLYEKKTGGGTKAQDAERKRLNNIALKYTGKSLDQIDEKAVLGQKPATGDMDLTGSLRTDKKTKKTKPSRRITPTIVSVPEAKKTAKKRTRKNTIPCDKGYKIVKSRVKSTNPNDRRKLRGKKLKEIMKSKGLSLIKASKYMKEHKITY